MTKKLLALMAMFAVVACGSDDTDTTTGGDSGSDPDAEPEFVASLPISEAINSIPQPPFGERWVIKAELSDEFNSTSLDTDKWYDYHPWWSGRPPGYFMPTNVAVSGGNLTLSASLMTDAEIAAATAASNPSGTYNYWKYGCAAVISKSLDAHFGYYECRVKANATALSTTFWLSTKGDNDRTVTIGNQPEDFYNYDGWNFSSEIDILEVVGRGSSEMMTNMNSNAHVFIRPVGYDTFSVSVGSQKIPLPDGEEASDNYNIYGCWWRDKESATFYLNNGDYKDMTFANGNNPSQLFWLPVSQGLNMVMETYDWNVMPTDDEVQDDTKNKSYYDWVRSYVLVDATSSQSVPENSYVFEDNIHFLESESAVVDRTETGVDLYLCYTAKYDREILFTIYDYDGAVHATTTATAYSGYAARVFSIDANFIEGEKYYAVAQIKNTDSTTVYDGDTASFIY